MEIKKIYWAVFLNAMLFAAQNAMAQEEKAVTAAVSGKSNFDVTALIDTFSKVVVPGILIFIFLSGIVSPLVGYYWYRKHGGKKNWIKYFAWLPLVLAVILAGVWLLSPDGSSQVIEKLFPLAMILTAAVGVVAPVIAYRKYNHNKDKKWIIWLSYYPLLAVVAAVFGYALKYFAK